MTVICSGASGAEREGVHPEGLRRTGALFGSVAEDYAKRLRHFKSDFTDGLHMKTVSSALYMFCATVASTIALGELARRETGGRVGVTEFLIMNGLAGMVHSLVGTQSLLVLRPTGPITAVLIQLYAISSMEGLDFYQFLAWTGFFVGIYMVAIAAWDLCYLIRRLTRFTHDLFAFFICTIYIVDGLEGVLEHRLKTQADWGEALFTGVLFLLTFGVSLVLDRMNTTQLFGRSARKFLHDYALPLAVVVTTLVSYSASGFKVDRVPMPSELGPTYHPGDGEAPRNWFVGLAASGTSGMAVTAAIAAVPIILLFFIDQNVSSRLTQVKEMNLSKGAYYNSSFLVMGFLNIVGTLFGLPFVTGSLPHSPQFARSLAEVDPADPSRVIRVRENRIAPFLMYALIGATVLFPSVLELIPEGAVDGILTFVGFAGLCGGNQMVDRLVLLIRDPAHYPKDRVYSSLPARRIHAFTFVQVALFALCWIVKMSPYGLAFPLVIVSLIPFRSFVMAKWFSEAELNLLDSPEHGDTDCHGDTDLLSAGAASKVRPSPMAERPTSPPPATASGMDDLLLRPRASIVSRA